MFVKVRERENANDERMGRWGKRVHAQKTERSAIKLIMKHEERETLTLTSSSGGE